MEKLKRVFITGLLVIIPISVSAWILSRIFLFLENILGPLLKNILRDSYYVPGFSIIVLLVLIMLVGFITSNFLGRKLLAVLQKIMAKLPFFNRIYLMVKSISDAVLGTQTQKLFDGVASVPFPNKETRTIGFITALPHYLGDGDSIGVFVPTTPNITTGFYLVFPKKDVRILDLSVEEGLKVVLSVGFSGRLKNMDEIDEGPNPKRT